MRLFNDRGSVICAAEITSSIMPGIVKTFESSAEFQLISAPGEKPVDVGGCVNLLTPSRPQIRGTDAMACNSCMIDVESWSFDRTDLAGSVVPAAAGAAAHINQSGAP